jgi:hypothetical protein
MAPTAEVYFGKHEESRSRDIGFVPQVLSFARERSGSLTEMSRRLKASVGRRRCELVKYRTGARKIGPLANEVFVFRLRAATSK